MGDNSEWFGDWPRFARSMALRKTMSKTTSTLSGCGSSGGSKTSSFGEEGPPFGITAAAYSQLSNPAKMVAETATSIRAIPSSGRIDGSNWQRRY